MIFIKNKSAILSTTQFINSSILSRDIKMYSKIIFIDAQVEDSQSLIAGVTPGSIVVVLDATQDGIEQITQCLTRHQIREVHIVSHGAPGCLFLGNRQLSLDTLNQYTAQLRRWSADSILLYGCNVAAGDAGAEFVEKLHQITRAEIAASTTKIGHTARGGNWELDFTTNQAETTLAFTNTVLESYTGVLTDTIFDANFNPLSFDDNDPELIAGNDGQAGAQYHFEDIVNIDGTQIDVIVEIDAVNNATLVTIDDGGVSTEYFAPQISAPAAGGGTIDFKINFILSTSVSGSSWNGETVALENFRVNSVDIDGVELVEYGGFSSFEVADNTDLRLEAGGGDRIRFTGTGSYAGLIVNEVGRVQTEFDTAVSSFDITMGTTGSTGGNNRQFGSNFATIDFTNPEEFVSPTVETLTTTDTTPTLTGTIGTQALNTGETVTVTVDGTTYTDGDGNLTVTGTDWTLDLPDGDALNPDVYEVVVSRVYDGDNYTFANSDLTFVDASTEELTIEQTIDTDNDGVDDDVDIDDDNDGVLDTVEAGFVETINGIAQTFVADPGWQELGNRDEGSNFGYSLTSFTSSGTTVGEIGGVMDRSSTTDGAGNSGVTERPYYAQDLGQTYTDADSFSASYNFYYVSPANSEFYVAFLKFGDQGNTNHVGVHFNDQGAGSFRASTTYGDNTDDNGGNVGNTFRGTDSTINQADTPTSITMAYDATTRTITATVGGVTLSSLTIPAGTTFEVDSFGLSMPGGLPNAATAEGEASGSTVEAYLGLLTAEVNGENVLSFNRDTDNDGIFDHLDLDSDNDGIPDNIEVQTTQDYIAPAADDAATYTTNDGLNSAYVPTSGLTPVDTDSDGTDDYLDSDSDEDGTDDIAENGMTNDGTTTDTDGDGLLDTFEGSNNNDGFDVNDEIDTPLNGILPDADNDAATGTPLTADLDYRDAQEDVDTDNDNIPDSLDLDDDNDGILDTDEMALAVVNPATVNSGTVVDGGTEVTEIFTDFDGYWTTSETTPNGTKPNASHDLLAFTTNGVTYTTGAYDDNVIDTDNNGLYDGIDTDGDGNIDVTTQEGSWQAVPPAFDITGKVIVEGRANDGDASTALGPSLVDSINDVENAYLTNGDRGLDLGTVLANIDDTWYFKINDLSSSAINDGVPDILLTQLAQPDNISNIITFYDENGDPIGNSVRVTGENGDALGTEIGTWESDQYPGGLSEKPFRLATVELGEFGLTATNISDISFIGIEIGNATDWGFLAFNDQSFGSLYEDIDTDSDGVVDRLDLDSDNDGIADVIEAGGTDPDNDGIIGTGAITDNDNDGFEDSVDNTNGAISNGTPLSDADTDDDGLKDRLDLDSDSDGIPDAVEAQATTGYTSPGNTVDTNGVTTAVGLVTPEDTDNDGTPDYLDADSDSDGTDDITESGLTLSGSDNDGDGIDDSVNASYTDPDGDINTPINNLQNTDSNDSDADYRSLNNSSPTATDDTVTVEEDSGVNNIAVLDNDDFGGDGAGVGTITVDGVTNGTAIVNDGGTPNDPTDDTIDFTPDDDFNGDATVNYTITDANGDTSSATVNVTVNPVNDDPSASNDTATVNEDSGVNNITVLDNDDFGGDGAGVGTITVDAATNGTATVNDGGTPNDPTDDTIDFTPDDDFNGDATVNYTITDANGDTSSATVNVTVNPVNDDPSASNDTATVNEDSGVNNITVLDNDDFGGDGAGVGTITVDAATNGTATVNDGGTPNDPTDDTIDFTPDDDFNGDATVNYTITDANGDTSSATVNVTVNPVNDNPTAENNTNGTTKAGTTPASGNLIDDNDGDGVDEDVDGDTLNITNVDSTPVSADNTTVAGTYGTLTVNLDGTYSYAVDTSNTDVLALGDSDNLTETFTYTVDDGNGGTDTATLEITVSGSNNPPTATDNSNSVEEDATTAVTGDVIDDDNGNGVDSDLNNDTLTISEVNSEAIAGETTIDGSFGTITINPDGSYSYEVDTTNPDVQGLGTGETLTETFTYVVSDGKGGTDAADLAIAINGINDTPVANDDNETTPEDIPVTIDVVNNDTDAEDDTPTGTITITTQPTNGTATVDDKGTPDTSDDEVVYTPNPDYVGDDTFAYTVTDSEGTVSDPATVTVTVEEVNDTPVATDDSTTTDEETPVTIDVTDNDTDVEDVSPTGEITIVDEPENGTVEIDDNDTPGDTSDDQVIYTPNENYNGTDSFTYTVEDSDGVTSNPATVDVTVDPVNDPPVANDDGATTDEDTAVTIDVIFTDTDVEDGTPSGGIMIINEPTNGTVEIDDNGTPDDFSDDQVIYTPNPDFVGTDSFTYTVTDSEGTPSNEAEVIISVGGVNDQPVAVDDTVITPEDTPVTIDVNENDTDTEDGVPTGEITIINEPENGTVEIDDNGTPDDFSDDTVVYTPSENYGGTDTFTYTVEDSEGLPSDTATVTVNVDPSINDVPVANEDNEVTPEDTPVTIDVAENDIDVEDGIPTGQIIITSQPENGTAEIDDKGTPDTSDDEVVYTPNPEFNGTDTFTYTIADSEGASSEPTPVSVDVESVNDAPVADDDEVITPENIPVIIDVSENDTDIEDGVPTGGISIVDEPTNGTVEIDDNDTPDDTSDDEVLYTPNPDFDGTDTFTYTIEDSEGQPSSVATVTVTVDDPGIPVAVDDGTTTAADTPVTINVLENDTDNEELVPETVAIVDNPGNGTVTINPDGTVEYTPNPGFVGEETFTYTVTDNEGNVSEPATVSIIVQDPDTDTDGDGVPDVIDLDDDNDGILDTEDGPGDTDGDGVPDIVDLDSDNDGISDLDESGLTPETIAELDTDNDGVIDPTNEFGDNGVVDTVETTPDSGELDLNGDGVADEPVDTDGDNVPDFQDLDSDNDGIDDIVEGGLDDPEGDGVVNGPDSDGDGVLDPVDATNGFGDENPDEPDTDGDNVPDFQDLDSDNDGINDIVEAGIDDPEGDGVVNGPDSDGDGIIDAVDENPETFGDNQTEAVPDSDNDGTPDFQDLDSDGDGTNDIEEAGIDDPDGDGVIGGPDTDGDGIPDAVDENPAGFGDNPTDTDGDGIPDTVDLDDDNDGILDELEGDGDTDGDGVPDIIDLDSDNDGISDLDESGLTPETIAELDTDNDGVIDPTNEFGDNGVVDTVETTPDSGELDLNGDGVADEPVDTDGDNVPDFQDLDSDNDGIDDIVEGGLDDPEGDGVVNGPDSDGDGVLDPVDATNGFGDENPDEPDTDGDNVPDFQDLDSDNDGINDIVEAGIDDPEGDGVVNGPDSDGDGIIDAVDENPETFGDNQTEAVPDSDNDGTPDFQDLDSDGDGTNDIEEAGIDDPDGDGVIGGPDTDGDGIPDAVDENPAGFGDNPTDTDGDGIPDTVDLDDDNDGILDELEGDGDTDGDGIPDIVDLDSDNDGIADIVESGLTPEQIAALDTDGDGVIDPENEFGDNGVVDSVETTPDSGELDLDGDGVADNPVDTDNDGTPDFQDLDSDNDGLNDIVEAGNPDVDGNGIIDDPTDTDGDGLADSVDPDNGGTLTTPPDIDSDGAVDYRDLDSDNDGIPDLVEGGLDPEVVDPDGNGIIDTPDTDNDGIPDIVDGNPDGFSDEGNQPIPDMDNDGTPDYQELDSDGDGTPDRVEAGLPTGEGTPDVDGDGLIDDPTDSDGDGVPDPIDSAPGTEGGFESTDTDGDGIPNAVDLDDDNDGILDELEGDGDTDGDGVPDIVDLDSDNDGIADIVESGLTPEQIAALDTDGDGVIDPENEFGDNGVVDSVETTPDSGELDLDGDGVADNPVDTDGDNIPDFQDLDSDNDGLNDIVEAGNPDENGDGQIDDPTDSDGDGLADSVDPDNGGTLTTPVDADGDNAPDFRDLDSDNDGINDIIEGGLDDPEGDGVVNGPDNDGDGILAQADPNDDSFGDSGEGVVPDTDNDGIPDYQDLDSDGDGKNDIVEAGLADLDGDGMVNGPDSDGDGIADPVDQNNDGFGDTPSDKPLPDSDGDGIPDFQDLSGSPMAVDDEVTVPANAILNVKVLDNDTDPDGDPLSLLEFDATSNNGGTVTLDGDTLLYIPAADFTGVDTFTYTISDGKGGTDTATVTVTVTQVAPFQPAPEATPQPETNSANSAPMAVDDSQTLTMGSNVTIDVLGNDTDPDGDSFSLDQFDAVSANGGTVTLDGDQLVYTPPVGFEGTDTFTYTIIDSNGETGTATVTLSVEAESANVDETVCCGSCPMVPAPEPITLPAEPSATVDLLPEPPDAIDANVSGSNADDILEGTEEADLVDAGSGDDMALMFANNDTLLAGAGDDMGFAGQGDDLLFGDAGNDLLWGDSDNDTLIGGPSGAAPVGDAGEKDTLYGNRGDDLLAGSLGQDNIHGGQGNDIAHGGKDNDMVFGELGDDTLMGEQGDDTIIGGTSNATTEDIGGRDLLFGGMGEDFLEGNQGNDTLVAGEGNDIAHGGKDDDLVYGNTGDDMLFGELGNDTLIGGPSGTEPLGETGDQDVLYGLDGDDWLAGNLGRDTLFGGEGDDHGHGGKDDDRVVGELGDDTLLGEGGNDTLIGGTDNNSDDPIRDLNGADLLFGNGGDDRIEGNEGMDTLVGGDGNDTTYGGQGNDLLFGEAGNDLMWGDAGDDTLCGGTGNDTLIGGMGNDTLLAGEGNDTFVLSADMGIDLISDFQVGQDVLQLDGLDFNQLEMVQEGNNTQVSFNNQLIAVLEQVNVDDITSDSFI